ncbi:WGR domain-containing protein [Sphingobium aromaticiconvertens]|uniref:WGR domain-containing protein n=1 Tax=Sphingobium aromaticiconvertens TaxID=365341 RepID=UPI00301AA3D0
MLPGMEPALPPRIIQLRALDPARNIARDYSIWIAMDLFDLWVVETCWGRIGARGQHQQRSFANARAAQNYVRSILKKRGGAHKRIGVEYQIMPIDAEEPTAAAGSFG